MDSKIPTVERLQILHDELIVRVKAIGADIHHKNEPVEKDFAEQVTQRENDDVLMALEQEARVTLGLIDNALTRVADGTYGICIKCQEKIPDARLEILPYATTCIKCSD